MPDYLKRLRKKAKRGHRGFPIATLAFYGPSSERASKVAVGILRFETDKPNMRTWHAADGDVRTDEAIAAEILAHLEHHGVLSVAMSPGIVGCPHEQGVDYNGEWCEDPACAYWFKRDRITGKRVAKP